MKRSEFLTLLLSPLVLPFLPSPKGEVLEFPNGAKIHYGGPSQRDYFESHHADALRYYMGNQLTPEEQRALRETASYVTGINRIT